MPRGLVYEQCTTMQSIPPTSLHSKCIEDTVVDAPNRWKGVESSRGLENPMESAGTNKMTYMLEHSILLPSNSWSTSRIPLNSHPQRSSLLQTYPFSKPLSVERNNPLFNALHLLLP
jgi:hypothetical protein